VKKVGGRLAAVVLVLAVGAQVAGCSGDDEKQQPVSTTSAALEQATSAHGEVPFEETVLITKSGYRPRSARVLLGGTVTWINVDPEDTHTAETKDPRYEDMPGGQDVSFDSHTLLWEEPYTATFHFPGRIEYESSFDDFTGRVDVIARTPPGQR